MAKLTEKDIKQACDTLGQVEEWIENNLWQFVIEFLQVDLDDYSPKDMHLNSFFLTDTSFYVKVEVDRRRGCTTYEETGGSEDLIQYLTNPNRGKCLSCLHYKGRGKPCNFTGAGSNMGNYKVGITDLSGCDYYEEKE